MGDRVQPRAVATVPAQTRRLPLAARRATRALLVVAALVAVALGVVAVARFVTDASLLDLEVYRRAVRAWEHGQPVYDLRYVWVGRAPDPLAVCEPDSAYWASCLPFTYPPFGLVVLAWTGVVGPGAAGAALTTVSLAAVVAVGLLVAHRVGWPVAAGLAAAAASLWSEPVRATVGFGQVNLALLVLVVLDVLVVPARFRGVLTGLATAVKLTPGIFVLFFLVTRQWRAALQQLGAAAAASLLTVGVAPGSSRRYWTDLVFDNRAGNPWYAGNQALSGLVGRSFGPSAAVRPVTWLLVAAVLALGALGARRLAAAGDVVGPFAVVALVGLLVSPISWSHHWVWALPAVVWGLGPGRAWVVRGGTALLALALWRAPQWRLPSGNDAELTWSLRQVVVGDAYPLLALLLLAVVAAAAPGRPTTRSTDRSAADAPVGDRPATDGGWPGRRRPEPSG